MGAQHCSGLLPTTRSVPSKSASLTLTHIPFLLVAAFSWEQRWWRVGVPGGQGTSHGALVGRRPSQERNNLHAAALTVVPSPLTLGRAALF